MTDSYEITDYSVIADLMTNIDPPDTTYRSVDVVGSYPELFYSPLASDISVTGAVATFTVSSGTAFYPVNWHNATDVEPFGHCTLDSAATSFTLTVQRVT